MPDASPSPPRPPDLHPEVQARIEAECARSPWLRIEDAADRAKCSPSTIRRLVAAKKLPACRTGRLVRIHVEDLDAYLLGTRSVA